MPTDKWGNATWLLFHTLAAQIDEDKFNNNKIILIDIIVSTCSHLPCPICMNDAKKIISKANITNIQNKTDFIEFLRQFHNIVNIKLGNKTYSEEEIENMYAKINLVNIISQFIQIYSEPSGNMRMIVHSFQRKNFLKNIIPKLNKLITCCSHK